MTADAVTVAPELYKVVPENDRVRMLEVRANPSIKTAMHTHPSQVANGLSDGQYRFTSPDGQSAEVELKAGEVLYMDPVEHTTEVIGTQEAHVILVELK